MNLINKISFQPNAHSTPVRFQEDFKPILETIESEVRKRGFCYQPPTTDDQEPLNLVTLVRFELTYSMR